MEIEKNSWKTARRRHKLSAPAQVLKKAGMIRGRTLDYGCGHGTDADILGCERFDPHFFNVQPTGTFDTILCTYVLNVIPHRARKRVVKEIMNLLSDDFGHAYFTVRKDITKTTYSKKSQTAQYSVGLILPVFAESSWYRIYTMVNQPRKAT